MKKISHCRACGSKALTPVFSLKEAAVGGGGEPRVLRRRRESAEWALCDPARDARACGLLQSAHAARGARKSVPSSRYPGARAHLRAVATEALELISGRDCAALDIGCADGALLSFYPRWVDRFGVDPSDIVDTVGAWAWTAREAFPSPALDAAFGGKTFDIITAASVLEECDDPRTMLARMASLLSADGVIVIETLYAPMALTRTSIEAFTGGPVAVYSLAVLERLARDAGLKIFRGALTDKDGGSVRVFLTHAGAEDHDFDPWYERLARLWDEENALALRAMQPYQAFAARAARARDAFETLIADIHAKGDTVHLLGAAAPSEAVLALAGRAGAAIAAAVEDGAGEAARLGVNGPAIISETESRAAEPDYLLAPAQLKREMMERWRESILLGAKLIVPTPEPHVVHAQNYAAEYAKALAGGDAAGSVETLRAILAAAGRPRLVAERPAAQAASA